MDTCGLFSFSLSIQVHQTFGLKISCIYDILFLGHRVISGEWQTTTSWTKEAGDSFSCETVLFISSLSSHRQNINMHVQNECRLNLSKSGGEDHCCVQLPSSWTEWFFSSRGICCHSEAMKLWLVIGREMRIPLAKIGQCAVNVICLVPNNIAVNVFFFSCVKFLSSEEMTQNSCLICSHQSPECSCTKPCMEQRESFHQVRERDSHMGRGGCSQRELKLLLPPASEGGPIYKQRLSSRISQEILGNTFQLYGEL